MRYLLDTHAFLWFITNDKRLSETAHRIIRDRNNEIFFSAASAWEISIKTALGRLSIEGDLEPFLVGQLVENGFLSLPVTVPHAAHVFTLPDIHKDPFDRIRVSQARLENMPLITRDPMVRQYDIEAVW
ncbi:MAG: type II toxin-antitoxin system VapC family toxin [Deltaproteobacteria bacterium]|nr:type II toxin-antitoxin system VapC family toxin [Deltaproteobacteria bacterium]MBW2349461.1 type II toxin-antitoxin system VapC family toxin [Deltaproteobacteria bacterium]